MYLRACSHNLCLCKSLTRISQLGIAGWPQLSCTAGQRDVASYHWERLSERAWGPTGEYPSGFEMIPIWTRSLQDQLGTAQQLASLRRSGDLQLRRKLPQQLCQLPAAAAAGAAAVQGHLVLAGMAQSNLGPLHAHQALVRTVEIGMTCIPLPRTNQGWSSKHRDDLQGWLRAFWVHCKHMCSWCTSQWKVLCFTFHCTEFIGAGHPDMDGSESLL